MHLMIPISFKLKKKNWTINKTKNDSFQSISITCLFKSRFTKVNGKYRPCSCVYLQSPVILNRAEGKFSVSKEIKFQPALCSIIFVWISQTHRRGHRLFCLQFSHIIQQWCQRPIFKCVSDIDPVFLLDNTGPTNRGGSLILHLEVLKALYLFMMVSCLPLWILGKSCSLTTQEEFRWKKWKKMYACFHPGLEKCCENYY